MPWINHPKPSHSAPIYLNKTTISRSPFSLWEPNRIRIALSENGVYLPKGHFKRVSMWLFILFFNHGSVGFSDKPISTTTQLTKSQLPAWITQLSHHPDVLSSYKLTAQWLLSSVATGCLAPIFQTNKKQTEQKLSVLITLFMFLVYTTTVFGAPRLWHGPWAEGRHVKKSSSFFRSPHFGVCSKSLFRTKSSPIFIA